MLFKKDVINQVRKRNTIDPLFWLKNSRVSIDCLAFPLSLLNIESNSKCC